MRKHLIKFLGGFTKSEMQSEISKKRKDEFRHGDSVYINNKRFNPHIKYFLLASYNGGNYWYVSIHPDSTLRSELENGVSIDELSFDPLETCPCCKQPILH